VILSVSVLGTLLATLLDGPVGLMAALPGRLIALLEHDLLQALPLFLLMGALLNRLGVVEALFAVMSALLPKRQFNPVLAGLGVGALLGPVNGSVGASVLSLARSVLPPLAKAGVAPADRVAVLALASTLGVVVPPSLVLILLGDAMMSAHTVAIAANSKSALAGVASGAASVRIVNTQDIFYAAALPALMVIVLCATAAIIRFRPRLGSNASTLSRPSQGQWRTAFGALTVLAVLLGGVVSGHFFAVEAAACGAVIALVAGLTSGRFRGGILHDALSEALAHTGALFALLVAATTLTLVFRVCGSDAWIAEMIAALPGGPTQIAICVLLLLALSALVLDAFEIVFVVVPLVMPALLMRVPDASWVAVLTLLILQLSFLMPPLGYALVLARRRQGAVSTSMAATARALAPFVVALCVVLGAVLWRPAIVHGWQPDSQRIAPEKLSDEEVLRSMRQTPVPEADVSDPTAPPMPSVPVKP
jgi:tripartite ATP-independent transporter DctM subunit